MSSPFKAFLIEEDALRRVSARMGSLEREALDAGEVVVRVCYSSINFKDALAATGRGRIVRRFPCVGGIDLAGIVVDSADPRFSPGDPVLATGFDLGVAHHGGYAEYARLPAAWVLPLPAGLSLLDAMALGTAGFAAGLAVLRLEHEGLRPESGPVLVTGATGGVGGLAVDMLSGLGHRVVALTGKEAESGYLRGLGAAEVKLRSSIDFAQVRALESALWAGAVDNVGGEVLPWILATLQQGGAVASVGNAGGAELGTTVFPFILRGVSLLGVDSAYIGLAVRARVWSRLAGDLRPRHLAAMTRVIAFDDLPAAFDAYVSNQAKGRTVVRIGKE